MVWRVADFPAMALQCAPTGVLRVAINLGNPLLARQDVTSPVGAQGIAVDLAQQLADALAIPPSYLFFTSAAEAVLSVTQDKADIGFFARDPKRAETLMFSTPYMLIEGSFVVRAHLPIERNEDVDVPNRRIVVGAGSAYDLFLSRQLRHAELVRAPSSPEVIQTMRAQNEDVAAGVREQLAELMAGQTDLRLLDGYFMLIEQTIGMNATRPIAMRQGLSTFIEEQKKEGRIHRWMQRHQVLARLAPPENSV